MRNAYVIAASILLLSINTVKGQTPSENKKVALRYIEEVINNRKLDLMGEVFAEKFLRHDLLDSTEKIKTVADQKRDIGNLIKAFPDLYYVIGDIMAEGDKVVVQAVFHGTHRGTFMGVEPSGNRIDYLSEIFFFRIQNGKIVERWLQLDLYNFFKKMKGEK